jgi:dihydroneopterin aldolase
MQDKIFLNGLKAYCIIGTLPSERREKQKVVLDLEFPAPVRQAAKNDDLRKALDYQKIAQRVTEFTSNSSFQLIETLADRLASLLLREFPIKSILLKVSKPGAIRNARNVGVLVERKKR